MRAGTLKESIALQSKTATTGDAWGPGEQWTTYATVRANVQATGGSESTNANEVQATNTYTINIRYRADVLTTHRIVWEGHTLQILSAIDPDGRHRELVITATEYPEAT